MSGTSSTGRVYSELVGGIGNQLFSAMAGVALSSRLGAPLTLLTQKLSRGTHSHGNSIEDLNWGHDVTFAALDSTKDLLLNAGLRASSKLGRPFSIGSATLHTTRNPFDSALPRKGREHLFIRGYFQASGLFLEGLAARRPAIASPSSEYLALCDFFDTKNVTAIHFRRGDYTTSKIHGLLEEDYYQDAISAIRSSSLKDSELVIFSDDHEVARSFWASHALPHALFLSDLGQVDDLEGLFLMSQARGIITANSTYSIAAAHMSGADTMVVAPLPLFKELDGSSALLNPDWKSAPSRFAQ